MALGLVAGLVGGAARKLAGKAVRWVGKQTVGGAIAKTAGAAAATAAASRAAGVVRGGPMAPPVLRLQQQQGGRPASLPVRVGQAIIPGGKTGREFTPYADADYTKTGQPIAINPEVRERLYAPPGYVIVTLANGDRVGVLKGVARQMGLWKPDPKPPVSGWDMRAIRRAAGASKRVKKLAGQVGWKCSKKGSR